MTENSNRYAARAVEMVAALVKEGVVGAGRLASNIYRAGEEWVFETKHAQYGLAVTRMLLGATVLGMLLTNWSTRFYTFGAGSVWTGQHLEPTSEFAKIPVVNLIIGAATNDLGFTALYVLLAIAAVAFAVGYRTRLALIVMFPLWVGLTQINTLVNDQSDNLTRIIMIALFFTSPGERWSFDAARRARFDSRGEQSGSVIVRWWRFQTVLPSALTNLSHNLAIITMAAQVFFIYVSGGLYKAGGKPWSGGWAIYDPIHTVQFGPWPELSDLVTTWAPLVAGMTILTVLVQIGFPLMLMRRGTRIIAMIVILGFHLGIAVLMGLPWFSLAMIAVDSIFIRDVTWNSMAQGLVNAWKKTEGGARTPKRQAEEPRALVDA